MIGKFSRLKQINHLYYAGLLPQITDRSFSLFNSETSAQNSTEKSFKKEKSFTLQKIKEKLKKQIDQIESTSIGNIQKSLVKQKSSKKITNKLLDTSQITYNSRIHGLADSPAFQSQKGKSFLNRQTLYPHKARALTEQSKKQLITIQKQKPMFSIKQFKNFLKNNQKFIQNDSVSFNVQSSPISKLSGSSQIKQKVNSKNLEEMEMNISQIKIKNSKLPYKILEVSTNLPCFIVKKTRQNCKQSSRKKIFYVNSTLRKNIKKQFLSRRDFELTQRCNIEMRKKYSEQIEDDLMQLSTPRNNSLLRKSIQTQPSLSAWQ